MSDEIFNKLNEIMLELKSNETIKLENTIKDELEFDSLDMMTLYFETETAFNIKISESDLSKYDFTTVQQYLDFIKIKLSGDEKA
ncbi:MAG: phosphopantetheine-binding protein [Desulfotalea sp.]